jgi:hypothetical protein
LGATPWTRAERAAIQDRCLHDGWERLLVVNLKALAADAANAATGFDVKTAAGMDGARYGVVRMNACTAVFNWERSANMCHESTLSVRVLNAPFETPQELKEGKHFMRFGDKPRVLWQASYVVHRTPTLGVCWRDGAEVLSESQVAAHVLERLVIAAVEPR